MTGFGSPCGACKFLRRKCVKGCVFAPYFCHEQGSTHFAAIHKVFGASNVSKLLGHLPINDRCDAALTISYEAQARLRDPIYGCVAHIFALQQQVVNLQAQLASLKAQAEQSFVVNNGSSSSSHSSISINQDCNGLLQTLMNMNTDQSYQDNYHSNSITEQFSVSFDENSCGMESFGMQEDMIKRSTYYDMDDLQSVAFAYLHHS
ncbi:Lateral organ boundaries LOB domain-containing protein [Dioscorea alata]|uniref:Lateral organ boundaries LOB domain-containing protein n=1 Tax=Dioscorea alata TaxID=55571 RepID=A0ACB7V7P9_DIOAL|nr:Lateral organ boundaries LOB domain-containing protein [Dioscorea alata]